MEQVVLVDPDDNKLGLMDKLEAHRGQGILHRAISVLLYRKRGDQIEILLQKRSKNKPLWPLFWSNTVCTHPRDGESYEDCAVRRLYEELGIALDKKELVFLFKLEYQARYNQKLNEYELDAVFMSKWNGEIMINPEEADEAKWQPWNSIKNQTSEYTPWFRLLIKDKRINDFFSSL